MKQSMLILIGYVMVVVMVVVVESQPLADSRSNYVNFFFEMLNPSWRQHRARLRPFGNQLGTPVVNVRGARDTSKQTAVDEFTSSIDCLFAMKSLVCFGQDKNNKAAMIECEARIDEGMREGQFSMGKVQTVSSSDDSTDSSTSTNRAAAFKINLYSKERPSRAMSMHSEADEWLAAASRETLGVRVKDKLCWLNMIKLFIELANQDGRRQKMLVHTPDDTTPKMIDIVGYLVAL